MRFNRSIYVIVKTGSWVINKSWFSSAPKRERCTNIPHVHYQFFLLYSDNADSGVMRCAHRLYIFSQSRSPNYEWSVEKWKHKSIKHYIYTTHEMRAQEWNVEVMNNDIKCSFFLFFLYFSSERRAILRNKGWDVKWCQGFFQEVFMIEIIKWCCAEKECCLLRN